jgi:hypothetical protein
VGSVTVAAGLSTALVVFAAVAAQPAATTTLAEIRRLDCTFSAAATTSWDGVEPKIDVSGDRQFAFSVDDIDTVGGTAEYRYGALRTHVLVHLDRSAINVIDQGRDGSMSLTSVFDDGRRGARLRATHSRTEYYAFEGRGFRSSPRVEQRYGYCTVSVR